MTSTEPCWSRRLSCTPLPFPFPSSFLRTGAARGTLGIPAGSRCSWLAQPTHCLCMLRSSQELARNLYSLTALDCCPNTFILGKGQVTIHLNIWACAVDTSCSIKELLYPKYIRITLGFWRWRRECSVTRVGNDT